MAASVVFPCVEQVPPRAPRLAPRAPPIALNELSPLMLPPSFADPLDAANSASLPGCEVTLHDMPHAPKLRPASDPVFDTKMLDFELPEAFAEDVQFVQLHAKTEKEIMPEFDLDGGSSSTDFGGSDEEDDRVDWTVGSVSDSGRGVSDAPTAVGEDLPVCPSTGAFYGKSPCTSDWGKQPPVSDHAFETLQMCI